MMMVDLMNSRAFLQTLLLGALRNLPPALRNLPPALRNLLPALRNLPPATTEEHAP